MLQAARHHVGAFLLAGLSACATPPGGDPLDPPPNDPPVAGRECDRASAAWIWCDDFEADRLATYSDYNDAGGRFSRADGAGVGGSVGMRASYVTIPQTSSGWLHVTFGKLPSAAFRPVDASGTAHREVYWRLYVRYPESWQGGGGEKLSRATSFVASDNWSQAMIAHVWSGGGVPYQDYLYIDPASGTDSSGVVRTTGYNDFPNLRWLGAVQGHTPLFGATGLGRWHCVEAHARLNRPGESDGLFELWVDNSLDASRSGLNWVGSFAEYGINAVFVENYWNGGSPVVQERYLDQFVISTERIGCSS